MVVKPLSVLKDAQNGYKLIYIEDIARWREDMNFIFEWQCFCYEKIKFISSSRRVMFFLLYRQNDIDKIIEGNYQNYVIHKLTC